MNKLDLSTETMKLKELKLKLGSTFTFSNVNYISHPWLPYDYKTAFMKIFSFDNLNDTDKVDFIFDFLNKEYNDESIYIKEILYDTDHPPFIKNQNSFEPKTIEELTSQIKDNIEKSINKVIELYLINQKENKKLIKNMFKSKTTKNMDNKMEFIIENCKNYKGNFSDFVNLTCSYLYDDEQNIKVPAFIKNNDLKQTYSIKIIEDGKIKELNGSHITSLSIDKDTLNVEIYMPEYPSSHKLKKLYFNVKKNKFIFECENFFFTKMEAELVIKEKIKKLQMEIVELKKEI